MNWGIIRALIQKDVTLYFRNIMSAAFTVLFLVFFFTVYFVMPSTADNTLKIGIYTEVVPPSFMEAEEEEGLEIILASSEEELKAGVTDADYIAGIAMPNDFLEKLYSGEKPLVNLYFTPDAPDEIKEIVAILVRELAFQEIGKSIEIKTTEEVLGPDLLGTPIAPRDRLRPWAVILIILMETLFMANLIAEEIERRTINALLITPVTIKDMFAAKGLAGISLAFLQAIIFMAVVGGLNMRPLIIILTLLLGSILVTGIGFLLASVSKDFMSVMGWGIPVLIIMIIPALSVIFPGVVTGWVKLVPSYYLFDTVHRVSNFGSGWADVGANLLILAGFCTISVFAGIIVLKRRFQ